LAKAARELTTNNRIALTGTPVENNVGDLWSIMDFLNPGLLGNSDEFKHNFLVPIQFEKDKDVMDQLKRITGPFILRRLKTDKDIIKDLPEKQEMKVFCNLTREQASLYEAVVKELDDQMKAGGIEPGMVLSTLSKLKQVCNHPAQLLHDKSVIGGRSGKVMRLTEMLEEALQVDDRVLVFSQYAEMGEMLKQHLQDNFGQEVLFLHGGVNKDRREKMVHRFQNDADGPQIFILSLKAGGVGLNLTRANQVFHFDRWWNPAVENQATDRAFRIGQTRNVQVHKFVCVGTLEEKIDRIIETKQELAANLVGTGESWLADLSDAQLRDLFTLGKDAVGE
jgi:SNF2 family DNA or RNA helicase